MRGFRTLAASVGIVGFGFSFIMLASRVLDISTFAHTILGLWDSVAIWTADFLSKILSIKIHPYAAHWTLQSLTVLGITLGSIKVDVRPPLLESTKPFTLMFLTFGFLLFIIFLYSLRNPDYARVTVDVVPLDAKDTLALPGMLLGVATFSVSSAIYTTLVWTGHFSFRTAMRNLFVSAILAAIVIVIGHGIENYSNAL
jgi:hypothetical protein